jgi:hypothetical protein
MGAWPARITLLACLVFSVSGNRIGFAQNASGPAPSPKKILLLFSEGKDVPGNIMLEQAVRAEMQKLSTNQI